MKPLSEAIYSTFSANPTGSLYLAVEGQLYKFEADRKLASAPYITYQFISDKTEDLLREEFEDVLVQFDIISEEESSDEIEDIYDLLKEMYDWCELSISGKNFVFMRRELTTFMRDLENNYWQYSITYRVHYETP